MQCEVLTLFPEMIAQVSGWSMLKRAQDLGHLRIRTHNIRDFTPAPHHVADDAPYGGGAGMVLKAEPIFLAVDALLRDVENPRIILPTPQGLPFTQERAQELSRERRPLLFICGHYEGIDERVHRGLGAEEISIGDYVLTGGELPTLVIIDAIARLIPGVLGDAQSALEDSFIESMLDYPHYTRPVEVRGLSVPEVLRSGNHQAIRRWRRREALRNTLIKRPDLLENRKLSEDDQQLLQEIAIVERSLVNDRPKAGRSLS